VGADRGTAAESPQRSTKDIGTARLLDALSGKQ
jgi:hypothetical protein